MSQGKLHDRIQGEIRRRLRRIRRPDQRGQLLAKAKRLANPADETKNPAPTKLPFRFKTAEDIFNGRKAQGERENHEATVEASP